MTARRPSPLLFALLALILASTLPACGPAPQPFSVTVPWTDGETSRYDLLGAGDTVKGDASWSFRRTGDGWIESFEITSKGKPERGTVELDARLSPRASHTERDGATVDLTYGEATISSRTTAKDGAVTEKSRSRPADAVDNEASLEVQRGLPFAPGYATAYDAVVPKTGEVARVEVTVVGEETLTVPAGTFAVWHVKMTTGMVSHEAWYAKDAPRLLVKYRNAGHSSTFVLRSWRSAAGAELHGSADPPPPAPPPRAGPPPIDVAFLLATLLVQIPLMVILPLALGARLARRFECGWKPWGAGALAFVLSQVVHLPLNWALGLIGGTRGLGLLPLPLLAIAAGLSAGICEETARWLMLRYGLRRARSFREAVQFGAGHGGIEAVILGVLVALGFAVMIAQRWLPAGTLGGEEIAAAADAYWRTPWYKPVMAGLERVTAITAHVALSVMVMRAVVRGRVGWLLAAIGAHAALDAFAVWGMSRLGLVGTEVGAGLFALAFAAVIWAMRDGAPATGSAVAEA